jgi:hypothetical protein
MNTTSRVLVAVGAVTLMTYGTALAQAPAQPPQAPSSASPASPQTPSPSAGAAAQQTATGELTKVDAKDSMLTVKTTTGEIMIKYDDDTKVSGASRNTAGLATMSGSQVVIRYRKEGANNVATSIEVKPAAGAAPGAGVGGAPSPGGDRPTTPGGGDRPSPPSPGGDPKPRP